MCYRFFMFNGEGGEETGRHELHESGELAKEFVEVGWGEVIELNVGYSAGVTADFVNLWCDVGRAVDRGG